jgi:uncharacterized Tic20 family protein
MTTTTGMNENTYAMLTHLSPLAGYIIPFGNIIGPLVMWLMKRDQSPFLERVGREALNFQITVMLAVVACVVVGIVTLGIGFIVALPLILLIAIADLVFIIIAAIEANKGNSYVFPVCLRLVREPGAGPGATPTV